MEFNCIPCIINSYLRFVVKCELIARRVGSGKGEFIEKKGDSNL
jgi:hypothetical protein